MVDIDKARRTSRQADSRVTVSVDWDGTGDYRREGIFQEFDEPEVGSTGEETRLPDGSHVVLPGLQDSFDATVTRDWIQDRDEGLYRRALRYRGLARIRVIVQDVDHRGDPQGDPRTYRGLIESVQRNGYDADSASPRTIQLSCRFDSKVAA